MTKISFVGEASCIEVPISKGLVVIVSDTDYKKVSCYDWYAHKSEWTTYARTDQISGRPYMHRFLMQPPIGKVVNHLNGNGLHNYRTNLEVVNASVNAAKSKRRSNASLPYRGVEFNGYVYSARITVNYKRHYLGSFNTAKEAALAYNEAVLKLRGPGFPLNEVAA